VPLEAGLMGPVSQGFVAGLCVSVADDVGRVRYLCPRPVCGDVAALTLVILGLDPSRHPRA
jgi:hypothetical protein